MLAADYADKRACPVCGSPMRRLGRWYIEGGEWRFEATELIIAGPRKYRPDHDGHRWTNIPKTVEQTDKRTGAQSYQQVAEWWVVATHECMGVPLEVPQALAYHERTKHYWCEAILPGGDCRDYNGPWHKDMEAPGKPNKRKSMERIEAMRSTAMAQ